MKSEDQLCFLKAPQKQESDGIVVFSCKSAQNKENAQKLLEKVPDFIIIYMLIWQIDLTARHMFGIRA